MTSIKKPFDNTEYRTDFQNIETKVIPTDTIDTYDLVFNIQMPSDVKRPTAELFSKDKDKDIVDYYCNNKIHIRLYFKDENIFDSYGTDCIISPLLYEDQRKKEDNGLYFASLNDIKNADGGATNSNSHVILKDTILANLKARINNKSSSPFKEYNTRYSREQSQADNSNLLVSRVSFMNFEEKKRYFDSDYQYYIQ